MVFYTGVGAKNGKHTIKEFLNITINDLNIVNDDYYNIYNKINDNL
jgi:hypothetical protein